MSKRTLETHLMRRASAAIVCALGLILAGGASAQSEGAIISFSISESGVAGAGLLQETVKHADGSSTVVPAAIKSGTIPAISVNRGVFGRFHLTLKVVGGRYYPEGTTGAPGDRLKLRVTVLTSTDSRCPVGAQGIVDVATSADQTNVTVELCSEQQELPFGADHLHATITQLRCTQSARLGCSALAATAAPPTRITLTVNGWTLTATKARPAVYLHHEQDQPLASETPLTIRVSIDHPLPKGWKLVIYHNGDVLSQGNGVWHKVCEIDGPSTTTSCGDSRPGRIGPFDDIVWASVSAPTYLVMHSDIYFHFNPP